MCNAYANLLIGFAAKKIPIEHILASTRGGAGRPGGGSGSGTRQEGGVNLEESTAKPKDACNC